MSYRLKPIPLFETLEDRRLLSGETWGGVARLIRQDVAADEFPAVTGAGQVIAVIDSGINYNHPSLGGGFGPGFKVVGGYDFVDNDIDPMDTSGHGTEVAGVLAGNAFTVSGDMYRGIAPDASLVALRVDGGDGFVPDARVEASLRYIIDHPELNVSVVNLSYGSEHFDVATSSPVYGDEIKTLSDGGVIIVAASGNNGVAAGPGVQSPSSDANVLSVGSVNRFNVISEFTERGALLDLLAPGEQVYTDKLPDTYGSVAGTSFSAPYVAGSVALMRSIDPSLSIKDVRSIFRAAGAVTQDGDDEFGATTSGRYARLDLYGALKLTDSRQPGPSSQDAIFGRLGNTNSVVVDQYGVTHFAYYDSEATTLKYATRSPEGFWSALQIVDDSAPTLGQYVSIALDSFGKPSVAYFDANSGDLRYAAFDGTEWTPEVVDSKNSVGLYPSLVIDQNDNPAISYYRKTSGDLRIARATDGVWTIKSVDTTGDVGRSSALAIDPNGRLGVAYENSTTGQLRFARESTTGAWSAGTLDSTTRGVAFISATFDAQSQPIVSYYDAYPADLRYARYDGTAWKYTTIASKGPTGLYTSVFIDSANRPNVLYYDRRLNSVYRAIDLGTGFGVTRLNSGGGKFIASAPDPVTNERVYSWFDFSTNSLRVQKTVL